MLLKISEEFSDKARDAELSRLDVAARSARSQAALARVAEHAQRIPPVAVRRGYKAEIRAYMKNKDINSIPALSKHLGVGIDTIKSIMANKPLRCAAETEKGLLKTMGIPPHQ